MRKIGITAVGILIAAFFFSGCASLDPFIFKELPETNKAIKEARAKGADKECPDSYLEVLKMKNDAEATYWSCRTQEAIEKVKAAREKALALCPPAAPAAPKDSDGDGVPDNIDQCPLTPRGVAVDAKGCPKDSDGDGVPDYNDQCPDTPKGAKVDPRGCWVIGGVEFDLNRWNIKPMYYPALDDVVKVLKANPGLKVEIQGHTDNTGSAQYNQGLSERRARAVMEYFMKKGIDKSRLTAVGYGLTKPIASNETAEGRAQNRRVELKPIP
jgi:outer membrane protein OmpA-like peptidoglycan-associated protein